MIPLPPALAGEVDHALRDWDQRGNTQRLWNGDAALWTGHDEPRWLGWLQVVEQQLADLAPLLRLQDDVRQAGFSHALLLGMGGSSLCPEVLKETFGTVPGYPELHVLDSTDPAQVRALAEDPRIDPARTLFVVSSKSGSTLEPNIFKACFLEKARQALGAAEAGRRFVAITDPGSQLEAAARADGFRAILPGVPTIGGRYSALSHFGMAPAAIMGLDVRRLLEEARAMVQACGPEVPAEQNPGVVLGTVLGVLGHRGLDKVTLLASPGIRDLGAWLEQLLAESTGKQGKGLIPVDREEPGPVEVYGADRIFIYVRLASAPDPGQDAAAAAWQRAGKPVVRIDMATPYGLGQELFRWEMATAVAGAWLGINPFDQPDVEASKVATRALTAEYEKTGRLASEEPLLEAEGLKLFADPRNAEALVRTTGGERSLPAVLSAHLGRLGPGDYFALLAYLPMNGPHERALQAIRHGVRDGRRVATCLGFGPRFLHSTGQAYKGGPPSGVFLQITADHPQDLPVPGQRFTFGVVEDAQARGDFQVLAERSRRLLRVHLGGDVEAGLRTLATAVSRSLTG